MNPHVVKELVAVIVNPFYLIFNLSLKTGKVPSTWKVGLINAIYKNKGSKKLSHGHYNEATIHGFIEFGSNDTSEHRLRRHKSNSKRKGLEKVYRNLWNHLPRAVSEATNLNSFKNKIDKLWNHNGIMYNPDIDIYTEMSIRNI